MAIADELRKILPFLRRFARALTGSQAHGDAFVRATLEAIMAEPRLVSAGPSLRVDLYRAFHKIWETAHIEVEGRNEESAEDEAENNVRERLSRVTPISRVALLLIELEGFGEAQAGEIVGLDTAAIHQLVGQAKADIESDGGADVMIIEDEPLISMQLQALVTGMGHRVCSVATTHGEAIAAVARINPDLILADVQLADGSSGIEAVTEILRDINVPAIFITAFPERLLTGERPEPTYLITKPFLESTVRAAISQAMYLGGGAGLHPN